MELTTRIAGKCTTDQGIITATNTPHRTIVRVPLRQTTPTSRTTVAHEEDDDYRACELRDHGDRPVVPRLAWKGTTIFFLQLFLTQPVPATPFPLTAESVEPNQTTNPSPQSPRFRRASQFREHHMFVQQRPHSKGKEAASSFSSKASRK